MQCMYNIQQGVSTTVSAWYMLFILCCAIWACLPWPTYCEVVLLLPPRCCRAACQRPVSHGQSSMPGCCWCAGTGRGKRRHTAHQPHAAMAARVVVHHESPLSFGSLNHRAAGELTQEVHAKPLSTTGCVSLRLCTGVASHHVAVRQQTRESCSAAVAVLTTSDGVQACCAYHPQLVSFCDAPGGVLLLVS